MNRAKLSLALGLIIAYGLGAIAFGWLFPGLSDDPLGAHVDVFYGGFAAVFLLVIAITASWRFVGLVGSDRSPVVRWIVVVFVVELLLLLAYFALALLGYDGAQGAAVIIIVNLAFVAFNEEVLFRGFLWGAADGLTPARRILFVSVIFGAFHAINGFTGASWGSALFQVILVTFASLLDGVIRYGTGSLWPSIVTHFLWDASGVLGQGSIAGAVGPLLQILIVVAGVVGVVVLAKRGGSPDASRPEPVQGGAG